jgi:hypothetical protein
METQKSAGRGFLPTRSSSLEMCIEVVDTSPYDVVPDSILTRSLITPDVSHDNGSLLTNAPQDTMISFNSYSFRQSRARC